MLDLLLFLVTAWAATAAGRACLHLLRLGDGPTRLERNLFGLALGLGALAYGMLLLGLAHGLYRPAGYGLLVLLLALGFSQHPLMARELQDAFKRGVRLPRWGWAAVLVFALLAFIPLVGVWTPPTAALEWDSLSYHLADPKMYLQAHRLYYLPWESHFQLRLHRRDVVPVRADGWRRAAGEMLPLHLRARHLPRPCMPSARATCRRASGWRRRASSPPRRSCCGKPARPTRTSPAPSSAR